jgi:hypothetical protein
MTRKILTILFCVILSSLGCGPSVPTGSVAGKVTYNGKPVPEGCLISFVSQSGFAAMGTANANGEYQLMMAGKPLVPAAKYQVSVLIPGVQGPVMTDEDERKFMAGDPETVAKFSQKKSKPSLPEKFGDFSTSGLEFDVKQGKNSIDMDLK